MQTLPVELMSLIVAFAPLFSKPVFEHAKVLLAGAVLAPGKRTVTAALRVMGKSHEKNFQTYHRVLNRARWSALAGARILLGLLVATFAPSGALVFGIDDTMERRRGGRIRAKGIYRDPVRSSHSHFVKASGLRWLCCMLLCEVSWANRIWALPFLTVLCPSERFYEGLGRQHQTLVDRAWQVIQLVVRWLPNRAVVFVADSSFAVIQLLKQVSDLHRASLITRLRMDAALYDGAPARQPRQMGRPRLKGARRPTLKTVLNDPKTEWTSIEVNNWYGGGRREVEVSTDTAVWYHTGLPPVSIRWVLIRDPRGEFEPQALLSTDLDHTPQQILTWFARRWRMEVTFEEVRAHLGVETQRQWSDPAIARTTPALMALYSIVTLTSGTLMKAERRVIRTAAWYAKRQPTFSDAIALLRRHMWSQSYFSISDSGSEMIKIPRSLLERLTDAVCYAA
ncbi:MAG TPA: transposase [Blastocatellia bacterium]|nr:transposase [Blastocatellia bacterium]